MKAVILAGGFGTRISEETTVRPKPMVEIGENPILWHIMKSYDSHGIRDFIICCGYKGFAIKEYFANYRLHTSDVTIDLGKSGMEIHRSDAEDWRVMGHHGARIIPQGIGHGTEGNHVTDVPDVQQTVCGGGMGEVDDGSLGQLVTARTLDVHGNAKGGTGIANC